MFLTRPAPPEPRPAGSVSRRALVGGVAKAAAGGARDAGQRPGQVLGGEPLEAAAATGAVSSGLASAINLVAGSNCEPRVSPALIHGLAQAGGGRVC